MFRKIATTIAMIAALALPALAVAHHVTVNAAYCAMPDQPGKGRIIAVQAREAGETVFEWAYDPTLTPQENSEALQALFEEHFESREDLDWEKHKVKMLKGVVGECPERKKI